MRQESFLGSPNRALISCMRAPLSWPNHLPVAPPPRTIILRARISTYRFWGDTFSPLQVVPQNIKHKITIWNNNSTSGIYPKELKARTNGYLYPHIHSIIILNSQKVKASKEAIDRSMDKQNVLYVHIVEYYSTWKKKGILAHATTSVNLEEIKLSEKSQWQTDILNEVPRRVK